MGKREKKIESNAMLVMETSPYVYLAGRVVYTYIFLFIYNIFAIKLNRGRKSRRSLQCGFPRLRRGR